MKEAHDAQSDLLSAEADGKDLAYSILMVHAQDHLTMALMCMKDWLLSLSLFIKK